MVLFSRFHPHLWGCRSIVKENFFNGPLAWRVIKNSPANFAGEHLRYNLLAAAYPSDQGLRVQAPSGLLLLRRILHPNHDSARTLKIGSDRGKNLASSYPPGLISKIFKEVIAPGLCLRANIPDLKQPSSTAVFLFDLFGCDEILDLAGVDIESCQVEPGEPLIYNPISRLIVPTDGLFQGLQDHRNGQVTVAGIRVTPGA